VKQLHKTGEINPNQIKMDLLKKELLLLKQSQVFQIMKTLSQFCSDTLKLRMLPSFAKF